MFNPKASKRRVLDAHLTGVNQENNNPNMTKRKLGVDGNITRKNDFKPMVTGLA